MSSALLQVPVSRCTCDRAGARGHQVHLDIAASSDANKSLFSVTLACIQPTLPRQTGSQCRRSGAYGRLRRAESHRQQSVRRTDSRRAGARRQSRRRRRRRRRRTWPRLRWIAPSTSLSSRGLVQAHARHGVSSAMAPVCPTRVAL